jgi:hypothetical protein|tara:strand:- start:503 stop:961 length:459 start_codon:yes stop_codon:yes gene_type:complete
MNGVYKIKFYKSSEKLNRQYDSLSILDRETISELGADSFFDYENKNKNYTCYLIVDSVELKKYTTILTNNLIEHKCTNISDDIIKGRIDIRADIDDKISESNYYKYDFFVCDVDSWIVDNLSIDIVLDKISETGLDSLNELEENFLKKYKHD